MRSSFNSGICYRIKFFFYHFLSFTWLPLKGHPQGLTCMLGQDLCTGKGSAAVSFQEISRQWFVTISAVLQTQ